MLIVPTYRLLTAALAALLLAAPACKNATPDPATTMPTAPAPALVGSTLVAEVSAAELRARLGSVPLAAGLVQYGLKVYRLTYRTANFDGQAVTASGALLVPTVPAGAAALPVLSYQHGTIDPDQENRAPSYYAAGTDVATVVSGLAASGYVVAAPDYIGYGATKNLPHPYEHAATLASASADMLRAAREFCRAQSVNVNQKNFLIGYSEGGFATMALHKYLQEQYATELPVTASAPGAGAYHKTAFARYILQATQPLNFLSNYVWVLRTYDRVHNLNRPLSFYFQEPYASQLAANPFGPVPNQQSQLFAPAFRQGVLNNSDAPLNAALADNDRFDWRPAAPMALFHGTADDFVPYFNSQDAFDAMQRRGAPRVELRPIQGANHFTAVTPYILGAYAFIGQF